MHHGCSRNRACIRRLFCDASPTYARNLAHEEFFGRGQSVAGTVAEKAPHAKVRSPFRKHPITAPMVIPAPGFPQDEVRHAAACAHRYRAAGPLAPTVRGAFLELVAQSLADAGEIWVPPDISHAGRWR
jgi:hypothetical protein